MNAKNLTILTILTLVVVTAALWFAPKKPATPASALVFPNLLSHLKDVTEINVATNSDTFTLLYHREDDQWVIKEKHDYPVAQDKVRSLLLGLADLTTLEAKTSNPKLYSKLGVEEVTETDAKSILLTLKKSPEEKVAAVILGRSQPAKGDSTLSEVYIRKLDEKQAWLAQGFLRVDRTPIDWLDKKILDVDGKRIRQVNLNSPEGEKVLVFKDKVEDADYQLADIPEGAKLKAAYELGQIANALSYLNINDVVTEKDISFDEKKSYRGVFATFDGLEVTMTTTEKDGKYYAKFASTFVPPATPVKPAEAKDGEKDKDKDVAKDEKDGKEEVKETKKDELKPAEEVKKEVESITKTLSGWVFEVPKYKADALSKKRADLITTEKEEKEKAAERLSGKDESPSPLIDFGSPATVEP